MEAVLANAIAETRIESALSALNKYGLNIAGKQKSGFETRKCRRPPVKFWGASVPESPDWLGWLGCGWLNWFGWLDWLSWIGWLGWLA